MPTVDSIWKSHPHTTGEEPILDIKLYPNQCAINLYAAMQRAGVNVKSFRGQLSWQKGKSKYAIRAQEVANWLASVATPFPASKVEKYSGKEAFDNISGRRGVIFFQNYWGAGNQGDHIDLWNGSRLTHWTSWLRIQLRITMSGWSDYRQAESIWFWQIL